jgi:diguanylate cyclase (GGDEF)-like protein/PAS domain S-box-containing protein
MTPGPIFLALLLAVVALGLLASGLLILSHERYSRAGWLHFFMCLSVAGWEACLCAGFLIDDIVTKEVWLRIATFCAVFLPALVLHMDAALGGRLNARRHHIAAVWVACAALAVTIPGNHAIQEIHHYSWGYFPRFGILGWVFTFLLIQSIGTGARIYADLKNKSIPASTAARRGRLLLLGLVIGSFGAIDLLPLFGIDFYPVGGVALLAMTLIDLYVARRYRLIEITPAFAAQQLMNTISDGALVLDQDGIVRLVNPPACAMLGYSADILLHRPPPVSVANSLFGWDKVPFFPAKNVLRRDCTYVRTDGGKLVLNVSVSLMREGTRAPVAAVVTLHDVTTSRAAQDEVRRLAYYDPLTNLPNRLLLRDRAERALAMAHREKRLVALLFLDLDCFKAINDSFGHLAADRLLREIAARLQTSVRATDTVSRQGGDEFLILLDGLHHADDVANVAQQILNNVSAPLEVDGHFVNTSVSIGISLYPVDGADFFSILRHADTALYHAKESGRNTYRFFTEDMNVASLERIELEGHLRHAVEAGQLSLHYQPQVDMGNGDIVGAEALLRWNHPELGEVPPSRFIPVAEASGLIAAIGAWVINEVCRQLHAWRVEGRPAICVAVNLSALQFRRNDMAQTVESALRSNAVDPSLLEIEITESVLLHEAPDVQRNLRALKVLGVRLAIDDFGVGYSSLAYLKRFEVDKLKIDRSFVRDVPEDIEGAAIVRAITQLGHSLGLTIVAEGVETHTQVSFLRECGCHKAQGYLFSHPVPAQRFAALFTAQVGLLDRPEASAKCLEPETRRVALC